MLRCYDDVVYSEDPLTGLLRDTMYLVAADCAAIDVRIILPIVLLKSLKSPFESGVFNDLVGSLRAERETESWKSYVAI